MIFNSLTFLVFLAVLVLSNQVPLPWRLRKGLLLAASYLFFATYHPAYVLLLFFSTIVDWGLGLVLDRAEGPRTRRWLLVTSLVVNLGLLGFFKYTNFLIENVDALLGLLGIVWESRRIDILLPVGISFYTFQTLSYTLDVYRREIPAERSFLNFALFVSFFPQLVAGPIVRARDFLPQLDAPRRATPAQFSWGLCLLTWGLFQKIVLSDALLGPIVDKVFANPSATGIVDAWIGVLAFSGQILFDFGGYSLCAIGTALCFGFVLCDNFRCPYAARGFSDFWRRWHLSLSQWLRDYLYVSLGGNRVGRVRMFVNLTATMLLGGLWHGASWNFVVWGLLHGLFLVGERLVVRLCGGARWTRWLVVGLLTQVLTFYLVCVTWVFFRAATLADALHLVGVMTWGAAESVPPVLPLLKTAEIGVVLCLTGAMLVGHHLMRRETIETVVARLPWWGRSVALASLVIAILHLQGEARGFIYFQF